LVRSGRSSVTLKKKRSAATVALIFGVPAPLDDALDGGALRVGEHVAVSGSRHRRGVLPRRRASTAGDYARILDNHIGPALAHLMAAVTSANIDALHRKITKGGSPYAANRCVAVLSRMFSLAVRWNMRTDNPCKGVDKNTEYWRRRYLSAEELGRLVTALAAYPDRQAADIARRGLGRKVGRHRFDSRALQAGIEHQAEAGP
jgi:hypothetical protein